jgi:hypothetical protein
MVLTAEQQLKVALLYEKAASDRLGVPPQQRAAFARKAKWFRMKARISAKKEAASALRSHRQKGCAEDTPLRNGEADMVELDGNAASAAPRYRSIAERIISARPTQA